MPIGMLFARCIIILISYLPLSTQTRQQPIINYQKIGCMMKGSEHALYHGLDHLPVFRISISGGPCGGKTTLLQKIKDEFTNKGFRVLMISEVPTMACKAGVNLNTSQMELKQKLAVESFMLRMKVILEDEFYKLALAHIKQPTIILTDRGTMDSCAYVSKEEFNTILDQEGWNFINIRDKRYDAVIFLTTAADGAEEFYTLANNQARHENLEQSRQLDIKTLDAWNGHPHLIVIGNVKGQTFDDKLMTAVREIEKVIGLQSATSQTKKYLVEEINLPNDLEVEKFVVQEVFLKSPDSTNYYLEDKVRKRGQKGSYSYQRNLRIKGETQGQFNDIKIPLNPVEYLSLVSTRSSPDYVPLKKQRTTFLYKKQVFIIDKILLSKPITIFRYSLKEGVDVTLPDFIKLGREITKDEAYRSLNLAKKDETAPCK